MIVFGLAGLAGNGQAANLVGKHWEASASPFPCGCVEFLGYDVSYPWLGASEGLYGIEAQPVTVQWVGSDSKPKHLPEEAYLLGR